MAVHSRDVPFLESSRSATDSQSPFSCRQAKWGERAGDGERGERWVYICSLVATCLLANRCPQISAAVVLPCTTSSSYLVVGQLAVLIHGRHGLAGCGRGCGCTVRSEVAGRQSAAQ